MTGEGEGNLFFASALNFRAITRLETLATQARDFWMYATAFASISSMGLEIEAVSFSINRFRKKTRRTLRTQVKCRVKNPREILFRIENHVFASKKEECLV